MAYGPPKVMKNALIQQPLSMEASLSPLSSRPKRSAAEGSAVPRTFRGNVFRQTAA
jgi:hypothetical protein